MPDNHTAGRFRRSIRLRAPSLVTLMLIALSALVAGAQEDEELEGEDAEPVKKVPLDLLDREPFYQMTLDAENGNAVLDIMPIETIPSSPKPTDRLRLRLLSDPEQQYDVFWEHIAKLRTYDQLVFDKAQKLTQEKDFDGAFRYFDYLLKNTASTAGLRQSVLDYLMANAAECVDAGELEHGMAILEELNRRDKNYRRAEVEKRLAQVADILIAAEVERDDFRKARGLIVRLREQYKELRIESLDQWRQKLIDWASDLKQQSEQKLAVDDFREAERLSRQMVNIWPNLEGAEELRLEIARRYPMVIVGVAETAARQDVTSIDNWPGRRTGRLTERTLLEFVGAGPEGGRYLCSLGEYYQSDDRRQLSVELNPEASTATGIQVDGYDVSRSVLRMADPGSRDYLPSWAALARAVRVEDVFNVHVDLRRPHVLPEAMLQIRLEKPGDVTGALSPSQGPYLLAESPDEDLHFVVNPRFPAAGKERPSEIVERSFASSLDAISALRRGDIDVIDYVYPDDAARLAQDPTLAVARYALPTVHVLVPSYNNMFTANQTFRRALVYGINREAILEAEILGNQKVEGCQVISGPFPVGVSDNDPLAYAYDASIEPQSYYPRLAAILKILARRELKEIAAKRDEEVPKDTKLIIGYPSNHVARVACQAIQNYLQVEGIDIQCELRELPPGMSTDPTGEVDLLYMQVAMWEPVIDARRLLAPAGVASVGNEYVGMALRRLDAAKNWREARSRLKELHRIAYEQVAVIPLWQTVNSLVYSKRLSGISARPLTLYQDVEQWKVIPRITRE